MITCGHHSWWTWERILWCSFLISSPTLTMETRNHSFDNVSTWACSQARTDKCSFITSWGTTFRMNSQVHFVVKKVITALPHHSTIENFSRRRQGKRHRLLFVIKLNKLVLEIFDCLLQSCYCPFSLPKLNLPQSLVTNRTNNKIPSPGVILILLWSMTDK